MENKIKVTEQQLLAVSTIALAIASLTVIIIGQSQFFPKRQSKTSFYPAPITSQRPGAPIIEPVLIGERPRGFPADLPLHHNRSILQAYRANYPGYSSYHTTVVFISDRQQPEVLEFYKTWLKTRDWPFALQPDDKKPEAVYAKNGDRSILVMAIPSYGATQVSVNYAQKR